MTTTHETPDANLQDSRAAVLPGLRAAVASMDSASAAMAAYHFGWSTADGRPLDSDGGKGLRPTLALLSARAVGVDPEIAVPGAVAVELVHNFSLIHDDVMDRDAERRHRPTVWTVWGVPSAILTGDAMLVAAQRALLASPSPHTVAACELLMAATGELIRGQTEDLEFEQRADVGLEDCQRMADGKTGALLRASACIGAVLAGAPQPVVDALADYGTHVGAAFQLVDDLLGIWGDSDVTGKPVLSDLRRHKKSLPVVFALSRGTDTSRQLAEWLGKPETDDEGELGRVAGLIEQAGGRAWAGAEADRQIDQALAAVADIELPADVSRQLTDLARFVVSRQR